LLAELQAGYARSLRHFEQTDDFTLLLNNSAQCSHLSSSGLYLKPSNAGGYLLIIQTNYFSPLRSPTFDGVCSNTPNLNYRVFYRFVQGEREAMCIRRKYPADVLVQAPIVTN